MRDTLDKLVQKMGIGQTISPYETIPYDFFNEKNDMDFIAMVSLTGKRGDFYAEVQVIQHVDGQESPKFNQVFFMHAKHEHKDIYLVDYMRILGRPISGVYKGWFPKGARFFSQCVTHINKKVMPDFEMIYQTCFGDEKKGGGYSGGSSSRAFKQDVKIPAMKTGKF